jgi:hypothetical protein
MQNPTNQAETPIEIVSNDANMNRTVTSSRKAAKRTLPFDQAAAELLYLLSSHPPQAEKIPTRKKPRLEAPLSITTDQATRKTASPDISVDLPPSAVDNDDVDANADAVTDTQLNAGDTQVTRRFWTLEEDAKLTSAVANIAKKRSDKERKTDWNGIAALVPGRARSQCKNRWHHVLNPSIDRATRSKGKCTEDKDSKLKDAVQTHDENDVNSDSVTATQPTARATPRLWTLEEDANLTSAVANTFKKRRGKEYKIDWNGIAALVPGRMRMQCLQRWHNVLDPSIGRLSVHRRKWTTDEDSKLKDAVQTHYGDKNWVTISALVPGRTKKQCSDRWHDTLDPSSGRGSRRKGKWAEEEDSKLKDAVKTHGGQNWGAIAALVQGRTKIQCKNRWHNALNPSIIPSGWTYERMDRRRRQEAETCNLNAL